MPANDWYSKHKRSSRLAALRTTLAILAATVVLVAVLLTIAGMADGYNDQYAENVVPLSSTLPVYHSRGAILMQHTPLYQLGRFLASAPQGN